MNKQRHYTIADHCCFMLDNFIATVFASGQATRPNPAAQAPEPVLSTEERHLSAALMRVNHCGEVCAQALYQGQSLTARDKAIQQQLQQSAEEEKDHLVWCHERLEQLNSHGSYFSPLFYIASFKLGMLAGLFGDRWSLGFLQETEQQVEQHLSDYISRLPAADKKSRMILLQMREDEIKHGETAARAGANSLPTMIKQFMMATAEIMKVIAYYR